MPLHKFSRVIHYDRHPTIFPILSTIDSTNTHTVPQENLIPLRLHDKEKRKQPDGNANLSGLASGEEGERKELDKPISVSPSSSIASIYMIYHW